MRTALTIAGSDSGGGAGIQADLKTFEAHGVFGTTAITAITAQNTLGVWRVALLEPDMVVAQIDAVVDDLGADAVKIGMLGNAAIANAVAGVLERRKIANVVLDTVMVAKGGARLLDDDAVAVIRDRLLPLAIVVTPNVPEAEALLDRRIRTLGELREAAIDLNALQRRRDAAPETPRRAAIVKGGHLDGPPIDIMAIGGEIIELHADRVDSRHTHGTGCTFAAAIAAHLAQGADVVTAARAAKKYVTEAIRHAPGLGHGHGPLGHRLSD